MMVEYSKYKHLPDNFIALGDSECQTSPVAGFGCTRSSVSAATLAGMLYGTPGPQLPHTFASKYFEKNILRTGWAWYVIQRFFEYFSDLLLFREGCKLAGEVSMYMFTT